MRIEADDYVHVAAERLIDANMLYEKARYSFALYAAGVAVESLLRAYVVRLEPKFDEAHDLQMLLKASNLRSLTTPAESQQVITAIERQQKVWSLFDRYLNERERRRIVGFLTFTPLEKKMIFEDDSDDFKMPSKKRSTKQKKTTAGRTRKSVRMK